MLLYTKKVVAGLFLEISLTFLCALGRLTKLDLGLSYMRSLVSVVECRLKVSEFGHLQVVRLLFGDAGWHRINDV
jgi:hypothetical protein